MRLEEWNGIEVPYDATVEELNALALGPEPVRWTAFVALGHSPEAEALCTLADFAHSPDCFVRRAAVEGIGNHSDGKTIAPVLLACLTDPNEFVVRTACDAVMKLRLPEAHDQVLSLLLSKTESTRAAALRALRTIWRAADFDIVSKISATDESEDIRKEAAWTLRAAATHENWEHLFSLWARDHQPRHRLWACELAGMYGAADVIPRLMALSKDTDGHVRRVALSAVDQVQTRNR